MSSPLLPALLEPSDTPALVFGADRLTYRELAAESTALAGRLGSAGRVAVWATPSLATCLGITGALVAGVTAIPINPRSGERELTHVVADAAPEAVLAPRGAELPGPLAALPRIDVEVDGPRPRGAKGAGPEPAPERPALIVYTSGTTGPPKGAVLSRAAVAANLDALADAWAWTAQDVLVHALPLFHVHGLVLGVLGVLRRGCELRHLPLFDADAVGTEFDRGATMAFGVPTHYHRLAVELHADPERAAAVAKARLLVSGSAALTSVDHARIEAATGLQVRERYGMTETLIIAAARADGDVHPGTVGRALRGVEIRLAPLETADPVQAPPEATEGAGGEGIGEIEIRGPSLFDGYLNRPDATAAALRDGWFRTGDIARLRRDTGEVELVGRLATDLIKSGGYKIGAGEIENALLEHPGVAEAAVTGVADADLGERVAAWVVSADGAGPPSAEELADHVATLLAPHKRPREVHYVDALPRNDMGKVIKAKLERPDG